MAIGPKLKDPAEPPEPSPRKLPFHVVVGIHTSTPISEVLVGVSVAATRQNAGRLVSGVIDPGGVKLPAGTDCVVMPVVPGGSAAARLSHGVAATAGADVSTIERNSMTGAMNNVVRRPMRTPSALKGTARGDGTNRWSGSRREDYELREA